MALPELLKKSRKRFGATQQEIAEVLGINRSTYTYYELGRLRPSFDTLNKLAAFYNISIEYFTGRSQDIPLGQEPGDSFFRVEGKEDLFLAWLSAKECRLVARVRAQDVFADPKIDALLREDYREVVRLFRENANESGS